MEKLSSKVHPCLKWESQGDHQPLVGTMDFSSSPTQCNLHGYTCYKVDACEVYYYAAKWLGTKTSKWRLVDLGVLENGD